MSLLSLLTIEECDIMYFSLKHLYPYYKLYPSSQGHHVDGKEVQMEVAFLVARYKIKVITGSCYGWSPNILLPLTPRACPGMYLPGGGQNMLDTI